MKKLSILLLLLLSFWGCKNETNDETTTSNEEQKAIVSALFNVGANGFSQGMNKKSGLSITATYPIDVSFSFDYPDTKGGNIHAAAKLTGSMSADDKTGACLGGNAILNLVETAHDFHVALSNGREVIINTGPSITFWMSIGILTGCQTFDPAKSSFTIKGKYLVNGIEYDIQFFGQIKSDGSCKSMSGTINGKIVSFDF